MPKLLTPTALATALLATSLGAAAQGQPPLKAWA